MHQSSSHRSPFLPPPLSLHPMPPPPPPPPPPPSSSSSSSSSPFRFLFLFLLLLTFSTTTNGALVSDTTTSFLITAAHRDILRHQRILETISQRRRQQTRREACELTRPPHDGDTQQNYSFSTPLISGAYTGTGQYFARFHVGTPAQGFLLILDTGSDLTWVKCRTVDDVTSNPARVFEPNHSFTFHPISCSSSLCKTSLPFSLTSCPSPSGPCLYDYGYADGSNASGFFGKDSVTVKLSSGRRAKLPGVVVGCTSRFEGSSFRAVDGVLGLGYSATSFAAAAAPFFGGIFHYCLVDHLSPRNATGFLGFGSPQISHPLRDRRQRLRHAALLLDRQLEPFYAVQIKAISLGGKRLSIPGEVWNATAGGGAIVDTGTSLTMLAEPAYRLASEELRLALRRYPRVEVAPFEFCYDSTGGFDEGSVPRLVVHMASLDGSRQRNRGARFEPPVRSYVVDVADGVKCIGLLPAPWPGVSTIGNIMQQSHYWELDVRRGRLSFSPSTC